MADTKREGRYQPGEHKLAVPCMWLRLEFEELGMHKRVREDIYEAMLKQVTRAKYTEYETWHCAILQLNSIRKLVADMNALKSSASDTANVVD